MEAGRQEACRGPDTLSQGNADHIQPHLDGDPMLKWLFSSLEQEQCSEAILLVVFFFK